MRTQDRLLSALLSTMLCASGPAAQSSMTIVPHTWLVLPAVDKSGRRPFHPDTVYAKHLFERDAAVPTKGESLRGETNVETSWQEATADDKGAVAGEWGWAYSAVEASEEQVMLARLGGASRLFVNGAAFAGDPYGYGFGGVPVLLHKGCNDVYVTGMRGTFSLSFTPPIGPLFIAPWDTTLPDVPDGDGGFRAWCGVLIVNATTRTQRYVVSTGRGALPFEHARVRSLAPLAVAKVEVEVLRDNLEFDKEGAHLLVRADVLDTGLPQSAIVRTLARRSWSGLHRLTFLSPIDDSVQECAVLPPSAATDKPRIVLSLHGAGVDCAGHAVSYSAKPDVLLVAPTNRRPYGFDWQDWGRLNAYEALAAALAPRFEAGNTLPHVYLTGHSMGGHGTWSLAANDPEHFLAIAPSAGWISFDTYGGRPSSPVSALDAIWKGADGSSNTGSLLANLVHLPTFILHGTADDNVPVSEAQAMEKLYTDAGAAPLTHYQAGAGHWWDGDAAPGVDCVDWPGIFELFRATGEPAPTSELDFTSADPCIASRYRWLRVDQPLKYGHNLHVTTHADGERLVITTENVRAFGLEPANVPLKFQKLVIDGASFAREDVLARPYFVRKSESWTIDDGTPLLKTPEHSGPFKRAFEKRFVFVYGTQGSDEEQAELLQRARSDAEIWWYRGNGQAKLVSDAEFMAALPDSTLEHDQAPNVVLYGNEDTNKAWKGLVLDRCPLQVKRGELKLGSHTWKGSDLGALFVFPNWIERDGKQGVVLVGAVADTGPKGSRLGYDLAYFVSGVGYPDYVVFGPEILREGDGGVLAAGWFDNGWKLEPEGYLKPIDATTPR